MRHFNSLKRKFKRIGLFQTIIITFIWVLLLGIPLVFGDFQDEIDWPHIFKIWKEYLLLFILFLINRFVLLPYLFFREKRVIYFISAGVLILMLFVAIYHVNQRPAEREDMEMMVHDRFPPEGIRPGPGPEPRPGPGQEQRPGIPPGPGGPKPPKGGFIPPYANIFLLSFLILGFDTGLMISMKWIKAEHERLRLEKENVENKLAFLSNQVSPHFLMNTLNNIHALIDFDKEEAKDSTITLSRLMRHLLYDSQAEKISLKREIEFVENYVDLMKLRFSDNVEIRIEYPEVVPEISVPPLLFTSFVENAFKHGISYQHPSYINISFLCSSEYITFEIKNSNPPVEKHDGPSGIGIANARNRLDLLYGENYTLAIKETTEDFDVKLTVPV